MNKILGFVLISIFTFSSHVRAEEDGSLSPKINTFKNDNISVVVDAGHGGEGEEGAHGVDGVLEKEVTLKIANVLDELLRERLRVKTVMTRTEDVNVSLADRTKIANDADADLFISIHTNASEFKNLRGIETYYLDNTNDASSLKLAQRENASLLEEGQDDLGFMLSDLIQTGKAPESVSLAHYVNDALHKKLSAYYDDVKNHGVKKAPFYVLVGAHMPCVLVEVSFIDHPEEGKRLISERYQRLVANGIYDGVLKYLQTRVKESKKKK